MEETTGVWLKRNGKLERCTYYYLRYSLNTDCKIQIHIYRKDGYGVRFVIKEVIIKNDCLLLDLLPLLKTNPKDLGGGYHVINFAFQNQNVDRLRIEKPVCRKSKYNPKGLLFISDKASDYTFWKDCGDMSSDGLKIVIIPKSEVENDINKKTNNYYSNCVARWEQYKDSYIRGYRATMPMLEDSMLYSAAKNKLQELTDQGRDNMKILKSKIKKVIYVNKPLTINNKLTDKNGNDVIKSTRYNGMVKVFWVDGTETVAYTSVHDTFNKEEGFKTCVMKYVFGNAEAYDSVDFWTNKYVKYPSSCIEVTEALCKLEKILQKDKNRSENQKGLHYTKFFRETGLLGKYLSEYKQCHKEHISEFKKLTKKYFSEMKGKEIYINHGRKDETFVAIK